jgi:hypothetical protein
MRHLKIFPTLDSFCPTSAATLKPKTQKMNLNPALQTERACVLGAPVAARGNARRVGIFLGDSIPTLLRLALKNKNQPICLFSSRAYAPSQTRSR